MPVLASCIKYKIEYPTELFEPILTIPELSQGEEGCKLDKCIGDILFRWREQPPRRITLTTSPIERPSLAHYCDHTAWLHSWLYHDPHNFSTLILLLQPPNNSLYAGFYPIKPVQSVYVQPLREAYNVFVFLNQDHYDDALMDNLLDQEADILDCYPETLFNFHYLPLLNAAPAVPENAALIFSR